MSGDSNSLPTGNGGQEEAMTDEQLAREAARLRFREHFPETTKFAEQFRSVFGDGIKIDWAIEKGYRVGRVPLEELEKHEQKHGPVQKLQLYKKPGSAD